jgi:hypothetical protein
VLFDSPDFFPLQNFTTDFDVLRAGMSTADDWRAHSSDIENLQARLAHVMQSETAFLQEFVPTERSADESSMRTNFAPDDSFVPQGKDYRVSNEGEEGEEVVVVGKRLPGNVLVWDDGNTGEPTEHPPGDGGGGGGGGEPTETLPDEASVDIKLNINRPLTDDEKADLEDLKKTIAALEKAIMELADNAVLRLPNGADVTGAELKVLWAKMDFVINDVGHIYGTVTDSQGNVFPGNQTDRGQANPNWGNPEISFNIDLLDEYNDLDGGLNYLVAHELGHISQATTNYYSSEITANDIARALLNGAGLDYLENPNGGGYTPGAPMQFSAAPSGGGGGGGPGGWGGGGGCGGDGSGQQTCW